MAPKDNFQNLGFGRWDESSKGPYSYRRIYFQADISVHTGLQIRQYAGSDTYYLSRPDAGPNVAGPFETEDTAKSAIRMVGFDKLRAK
jgi:hypothetical protein